MRSGALVAAAVLACAGCMRSQPAPCSSATGDTITVRGIGSQRVKPDGVALTVGVETHAASAVDAFNANAQKVKQVVEALKQHKVAQEEMQTSELDVYPVTSSNGPITGFRVSGQVLVRRRDIASAPMLIQAALAAGANQVGGVRFFVSDPAALQRRGLELALQDARSKAEALASLSSRRLGAMLCIAEGANSSENTVYERLASLGYVSEPTIQAGSQEVAAHVSVVFEMK